MIPDPGLTYAARSCYIALLIAGVLACGMTGLFVLRRGPKDSPNRVFFGLMAFFSLWDLMELAAILTLDGEMATQWMRHLAVPLTLSAAALCHFSLHFPRSSPLAGKWWLPLAIYGPALIVGAADIAVSMGYFPAIAPVIISFSWGMALTRTWATTLVKAVLVVYLAIFGRNLALSYNQTDDPMTRGQIRTIFAGLVLPAFLGAIAIVAIRYLTPLYRQVCALARATGIDNADFICYPYGLFPAIFVIGSLFIAYAILRYGFLEIRVIVNRMIFLTVLTSVLACIYVVVSELLEDLFKGWLHDDSRASGIVAALVVAAFFSPVTTWISRLVQRIFLKEVSDFRDASDRACNEIGLSHGVDAAAALALKLFSTLEGVVQVQLEMKKEGPGLATIVSSDLIQGAREKNQRIEETVLDLTLGEKKIGSLKLTHSATADIHWVRGASQRFLAMLTMVIAQNESRLKAGNEPGQGLIIERLSQEWKGYFSRNVIMMTENQGALTISADLSLSSRLGAVFLSNGSEDPLKSLGIIFSLSGDAAACGIEALSIYHRILEALGRLSTLDSPLNSSQARDFLEGLMVSAAPGRRSLLSETLLFFLRGDRVPGIELQSLGRVKGSSDFAVNTVLLRPGESACPLASRSDLTFEFAGPSESH